MILVDAERTPGGLPPRDEGKQRHESSGVKPLGGCLL